eukprot:Nk52_evm44s2657 gene=Nk52_evmTU44s2657
MFSNPSNTSECARGGHKSLREDEEDSCFADAELVYTKEDGEVCSQDMGNQTSEPRYTEKISETLYSIVTFPFNAVSTAASAMYNSLPNWVHKKRKGIITFDEACSTMETGDILLFHGEHFWFSDLVEYFGNTKFSHVAIVLKPPHFFKQSADNVKTEFLILESGEENIEDVIDGEKKFGVQIVDLDNDYIKKYTGKVMLRQLIDKKTGESYGKLHHEEINSKLRQLYPLLHEKPYDIDPMDFLKAKLKFHYGDAKKVSAFFCSALAAYVYGKLGLIKFEKGENDGWVMYGPKDFSTEVDGVVGLSESVELLKEQVIIPNS